jgi:putative membrane protein
LIQERFFGRWPIAWIGFALAVLAIPLITMAAQSGQSFVTLLPTVNATLNTTSAVLLVIAWRAIKAGHRTLHWQTMVAAVCTSTIFLVFYLIRFKLTGTHRYPLTDWTRPVYLTILSTHTLLAAAVPFLVGRTLWLAAKGRTAAHRKIARWTLPIWLYVSVTGVIVYLLLYHHAA